MIVGEAHIVVKAITTGVRPEIRKAFNDAGKDVERSGQSTGRNWTSGFSKGVGGSGKSPLSKFMNSLNQQAQGARKAFDALLTTSYMLGPAISGIVGAISALVGALGAVGGMAAGAASSLVVLPGIFAAVAQAAITLKFAFAGVFSAIAAGTRQMNSGGGSIAGGAKKIKKDLTSYRRAVRDANIAVERLTGDIIRSQAEADQQMTDAVFARADAEAEAAQMIIDAKQEVANAQEELNQAYIEAQEIIQQLNFDAEDAVIGEKKAALELEKARDTLRRAQDLPPNSRGRKEAELAFAQADLNYRKASDTNKDIAKEKERLDREGADGTSVVINAKNKLASATRELAETEYEAAKMVNDALRAEYEAYVNVGEVQRENMEAMDDALQRQADAYEDLEKAKNQAFNTGGGGGGGGGPDAYALALSKLPKPAQEFVKFMVDEFLPATKDLQAAAGKEFFPKLISGMRDIKDNLFPALLPLLEETGSKLGDIALGFTDYLSSGPFIAEMTKIWQGNDEVLKTLGGAALDGLKTIVHVLGAAMPLILRFAKWIAKGAKALEKMFDSKAEQSELTSFFQRAGNVAAAFGRIFGDVFSGMGNIISDLMKPGSGGWILLQFFKDAAQKFKEFTENDPESIRAFFQDAARNAIEIMKAVGSFVGEFLKLGQDAGIGTFAKDMGALAPQVGAIAGKMLEAGPSIATFIGKMVEFVDLATDSGAIGVFFDTLTGVVGALVSALQNPAIHEGMITVGRVAAALVALRLAWGFLKIPLLAIISPFTKIVGLLITFGPAIGGALANFGAFVGLFIECGPAALALVNPITWVVAAIAGLVAAFVAMWNESEIFREAIKKLVDGVLTRAKEIFEKLKQKVENALKPLGGMEGVVDKLKSVFKFLGDIIGRYVVPLLEGGLKNALEIVGAVFGTIIDTVGNVISAVMGIIDAVKAGDWGGVFQNIVNLILAPFNAIGSNLIDLFKNMFNNIVNAIKGVLGIASPSQVFLDIGAAIVTGLMNALGALLGLVTGFFTDTIIPFVLTLPSLFLTAMDGLWDGFLSIAKAIFIKVGEWVITILLPFITGLPLRVLGWLKGLWDGLWSLAETALIKVGTWVLTDLVPAIQKLPLKVLAALAGLWNGLWSLLETAWTTVTTKLATIWDEIFGEEGWFTKFKNKIGGIWDGLTSGLQASWALAKQWWNQNVAGKGITLGGFSVGPVDVPKVDIRIPALAYGGVIPATPGGVLARIGEAGKDERVEPLDPDGLSKRDKAMIQLLAGGGSGGPTINVYPSAGMDEKQLANEISRQLSFAMRRGST